MVLTCACFESLQTPTTTFFSSTWSPKSFISNTRMGGCSLNGKYKYHKNVHVLFLCVLGVSRGDPFMLGNFLYFFSLSLATLLKVCRYLLHLFRPFPFLSGGWCILQSNQRQMHKGFDDRANLHGERGRHSGFRSIIWRIIKKLSAFFFV